MNKLFAEFILTERLVYSGDIIKDRFINENRFIAFIDKRNEEIFMRYKEQVQNKKKELSLKENECPSEEES